MTNSVHEKYEIHVFGVLTVVMELVFVEFLRETAFRVFNLLVFFVLVVVISENYLTELFDSVFDVHFKILDLTKH
jgi:hypothetical protein